MVKCTEPKPPPQGLRVGREAESLRKVWEWLLGRQSSSGSVGHRCLQCCLAVNPFSIPQPGRGPLKQNTFEPPLKHVCGSSCPRGKLPERGLQDLASPFHTSLMSPHPLPPQHSLVKLSCMALFSLPLVGLCIIVLVIYKALTKCQPCAKLYMFIIYPS